jgi:hypothetical protein
MTSGFSIRLAKRAGAALKQLGWPFCISSLLLSPGPSHSQIISKQDARNAAIHPVASAAAMAGWLGRVPRTRDFPPDFDAILSGGSPLFILEMSTAPGCTPCADLWGKVGKFRARYRWQIATISSQEALLRSGRLGLPWVGHPVAWVRPINDPQRIVPVAIGTDHEVNLARNAYLAAKILTGVRPAAGLRAMAKYTGIVGVSSASQGWPR